MKATEKYYQALYFFAIQAGFIDPVRSSNCIYSFLLSVGVAYNIHQKTLSDTVKREGLHAGAPGYKFIIFKSVFQTITYPDLECFNKDGVPIELNIKLQYRARPNNLLEIIKQFKDSENYLDILK